MIAVEAEVLAPDRGQVFAGQHHVRAADQRREVAVNRFHVHGWGSYAIEKFAQSVEFVIAQWLLRRRVVHDGSLVPLGLVVRPAFAGSDLYLLSSRREFGR
jgi:hypothetical protein